MNPIKKAVLVLCTFAPSPLRLLVWRILGFSVGKGCRVGIGSLVVAECITLADGATIEPLSFIYAPKLLELGERSRISIFVRIMGYGQMKMHAQSFVGLGCLIDCTSDMIIGERSQLGPRGIYYTHGSTGLIFNVGFPHRFGPITIGKDCWLGMNVLVYPRVTVGDESIVFPAVSLKENTAARTAILPNQNLHREMPIDYLKASVSEETQRRYMKELFEKFAAKFPRAVRTAHTGGQLLQLDSVRGIYLREDEERPVPDERMPRELLIWQLTPRDLPSFEVTFCFQSLQILGPRSEFSDSVSAFLCETGSHFVYRKAVPRSSNLPPSPEIAV